MLGYSTDHTLYGYVQWSLSAYAVQDLPPSVAPIRPGGGFESSPPTECHYRDFRTGPNGDPDIQYRYNMAFWHVLAARLALVLVLEHFILVLTRIVAYLVPDLPSWLQAKILRQNYLAREAFYESESKKINQQGSS